MPLGVGLPWPTTISKRPWSQAISPQDDSGRIAGENNAISIE
jgi:hypothetical protein